MRKKRDEHAQKGRGEGRGERGGRGGGSVGLYPVRLRVLREHCWSRDDIIKACSGSRNDPASGISRTKWRDDRVRSNARSIGLVDGSER